MKQRNVRWLRPDDTLIWRYDDAGTACNAVYALAQHDAALLILRDMADALGVKR